MGRGKDRVAYYYDSDFQQFYFGQNHPMKPHRLTMTHQLVLGYGLHKKMEMFVSYRLAGRGYALPPGRGKRAPASSTNRCPQGGASGADVGCVLRTAAATRPNLQRPRKAHPAELAQFHAEDYVEFLSKVTPDNVAKYTDQLRRHNINEDCPIFDNMFKCVCACALCSRAPLPPSCPGGLGKGAPNTLLS